MSDKKETIFADGFIFKLPVNAPDWVTGGISVKVDEAIDFLKKHKSKTGWVNLNILEKKGGGHYMKLDTWEPKEKNLQRSAPKAPAVASNDEDTDDLPF